MGARAHTQADAGWPCLQVDLLQQLVFAAKRLGQSAVATRHMTFLLQTMWRHLSPGERKEMALQLQALSAQCEGAPVPLVLESGIIIPPANLTDLPVCELFAVRELAAHVRPLRRVRDKVESSPFLFTPIHFNSTADRRTKKDDTRIAFRVSTRACVRESVVNSSRTSICSGCKTTCAR